MSTFTRILSIMLMTMSLASGVITNQVQGKNTVVVQVKAQSNNFDTMLAEGLASLATQPQVKGTATVIIHYADTQIVAHVKVKDLHRLITNQITYDQFVRNYVLFS